jgi:lipid II:glycine glycyltransferase (peptidoglycan interpeptide bridge formation enzyme)
MPPWLGAERTRAETTHLLDLSVGFERLWSETFGGNVRTACRKAERLGVRVARESGGIEEIARLYRGQVDDWRNHTPFPPALFRSLVERGGDSVEGWVARREGEVVAGKLMLLHGDHAHSWVAVNRPEAKRLRASPLLHCRIMEDLCGRGIRWYNFGSSRGAPGVESFKEGLGGTSYPYATCLREAGWFRPLHRLQYRARGIRGGV